ncbi:MAG: SAM-dependent methyltransferase [Coprococcus sp.]|nr:SAM-dependent methyltransferase [Coprococcus sp.]
MNRFPATFEEKMRRLLGGEFDAYIDCYTQPRYNGLRVNTRKISVPEFQRICPFPLRQIPWIENGFYYDGEKVSPSRHPYYFAGLYYLQEPSAMTPANRLPVEAGERVLDLCAAPGGKATELAAKLAGSGILAANDISVSRARGLLKNLEVFGVGNMMVLSEEPGNLEAPFSEYFDKILIDAPCSGEGMFRKDKRMIKAWEEHGPSFFAKLQRNIILQAAHMLRPGGMLLYSTCTFDPEENERIIEHLIEHEPEFRILPISSYEGFSPGMPETTSKKSPDLARTVRIFPHKMEGEGHFMALLKKGDANEGTAACRCTSPAPSQKRVSTVPKELEHFFQDVSWKLQPERLSIHGEKIYYLPEGMPQMGRIRALRTGLLLGELKKNRFEPSQALAMNLTKQEYSHTLDFSSEDTRIWRYLKGETIETDDTPGKEKGWYLVCVDGFPLGWGKLQGGILKNKYLPGWRVMS